MGNQHGSTRSDKQLLSFEDIGRRNSTDRLNSNNSLPMEPTLEAILALPDFRPVIDEKTRTLQGVLRNWGSETDAVPNADPHSVKALAAALGAGVNHRAQNVISQQTLILEKMKQLSSESEKQYQKVKQESNQYHAEALKLRNTAKIHEQVGDISESLRRCMKECSRLQSEINILESTLAQGSEESVQTNVSGEESKSEQAESESADAQVVEEVDEVESASVDTREEQVNAAKVEPRSIDTQKYEVNAVEVEPRSVDTREEQVNAAKGEPRSIDTQKDEANAVAAEPRSVDTQKDEVNAVEAESVSR